MKKKTAKKKQDREKNIIGIGFFLNGLQHQWRYINSPMLIWCRKSANVYFFPVC